MKKRRSPTEFIESADNPELESGYIKFPGEELIDVSGSRKKDSVYRNLREIDRKYAEKFKDLSDRQYVERFDDDFYPPQPGITYLHTHPSSKRTKSFGGPSFNDIILFVTDPQAKTEMIAQRDVKTGKVSGYFVLRKTKETVENEEIREPIDLLIQLEKSRDGKSFYKKPSRTTYRRVVDKLISDYDLKYRGVPAKGYYFDKSLWVFKKKPASLESAVITSVFVGISLVIAFLFLNNISGFAISSEITKSKTNLILRILFVLTIVLLFFSSINKKRKK